MDMCGNPSAGASLLVIPTYCSFAELVRDVGKPLARGSCCFFCKMELIIMVLQDWLRAESFWENPWPQKHTNRKSAGKPESHQSAISWCSGIPEGGQNLRYFS